MTKTEVSALMVILLFVLLLKSCAAGAEVRLQCKTGDLWAFVRGASGWQALEAYPGRVIEVDLPYCIAISDNFNGGFPDKKSEFFSGTNLVLVQRKD